MQCKTFKTFKIDIIIIPNKCNEMRRLNDRRSKRFMELVLGVLYRQVRFNEKNIVVRDSMSKLICPTNNLLRTGLPFNQMKMWCVLMCASDRC